MHANQPGVPGKPTKGSWELGTLDSGVGDRIPGPTNGGIDSPSPEEFPPRWILRGHWRRVSRIYLQQKGEKKKEDETAS